MIGPNHPSPPARPISPEEEEIRKLGYQLKAKECQLQQYAHLIRKLVDLLIPGPTDDGKT